MMSDSAVLAYYSNQAGSGLSVFHGSRTQRGSGIWGSIWKGAVLPSLKWLGKRTLTTASNVAKDVVDGVNIKSSLQDHLQTQGQDMVKAATKRARKFVLKGEGAKRRKRTSPSKSKPKKRTSRTNKKKKSKIVPLF